MLNRVFVHAFFASLLLTTLAHATPGSLTKQFSFSGTLFQTDGVTPLLDSSVGLRIQIYNQAKTCVFYDESHTVNTTATGGFFSISVGGGTRTPTEDPGNIFDKIFHNIGFASPSASNCASGYSPIANEVRYLRVTVTPTSGTPETLSPDFKILPTPSALVAESLNGGLDASNILKSNTAGAVVLTQANLESVFNSTQMPKLTSLLAGTSSMYAPISAGGGMSVPSFAGVPGAVSPGHMWYDSSSNQMKFYNGTTNQTLSTGGASGTVTSVSSSNTDIGVASGTTTPVLSLNTGTGANQIVKLDGTSRLPAVDASNLTSINAASVSSGSLSVARLPIVPVDKGGTGVAALPVNSLLTGNGTGTALSSLTCTSGQIVSFNVSGPICAAPGGGTGDFRADGTVAMMGQLRAASGSIGAPGYAFDSDTDTGIFYPAANTIAFTSGANEKMRIDSTGNVGIGTTAPSAKLHVSGGSLWADDIKVIGGVFGNSVALKLGVNATEFMRIEPTSGYVGIGTNAPSHQLHVISSNGYSALFASTGTNTSSDVKIVDADNDPTRAALEVAGNGGAIPVLFAASSGRVGIGTTTPSSRLDVNGQTKITSGTATALQVDSTGTNYHGIAVTATGASASGVSATGLLGSSGLSGNSQGGGKGVSGVTDTGVGGYFAATASGHAIVTGGGNVGIGTTNPTYLLHVNGTAGLASGTSWTNASDARLKDVQGDYEYGLSEIVQLHTVRYNYKKNNPLDLPSDVNKTGFIAQEVQKVIPEAVHERKDGYLEINVDPIHWAVVNAIKDLYHLFLDQSDEISELKKKNLELENRLQQIEQALSSK